MSGFSAPAEDTVQAEAAVPGDIVAFDEGEAALIAEAVRFLRAKSSSEADTVARRAADVEDLGRAVSRFPTVLEFQRLGASLRDHETLAESLSRAAGSAHLLHTPTRVVAGRSFLVAKIHALAYASLAAADDVSLSVRFRSAILGVVSTLLMEDVYLSCLEDEGFSAEKKRPLLAGLMDLWDRRRDPGASSHVPALAELWAARDSQAPVFGTMEGACELMRLSLDLKGPWLAFVANRLEDRETQEALEEFLFALTFEEIEAVRGHLANYGICTADGETVRFVLGRKPLYSAAVGTDPRGMYEFYAERRDAARARKRTGAPGPKRTLEELYLAYLVSTDR